MFSNIGPLQLLIVFLIVLLIFGTKKLRNMGGDLGSAIRDFRKGMSGDDSQTDNSQTDNSKVDNTKAENGKPDFTVEQSSASDDAPDKEAVGDKLRNAKS